MRQLRFRGHPGHSEAVVRKAFGGNALTHFFHDSTLGASLWHTLCELCFPIRGRRDDRKGLTKTLF
jgi:hypothetical protein